MCAMSNVCQKKPAPQKTDAQTGATPVSETERPH